MGKTTAELLSILDRTFKSITVGNFGQSLLATQKFPEFVRAMQAKTSILPEARFLPMDSHKVDIDRIAFIGRIMTSGKNVNNTTYIPTEAQFAHPVTFTNQLIAKELLAVTGIQDDALRRNIERGNFEGTLVDLLGEAGGRDMEEWASLADADISTSDDLFLSLTDGWAKLAANKVYGGLAGDFDPTADTFPENMFDALLLGLPKQYLEDRASWRFFVTYDVEDGYRDILRSRNTILGDIAQTTGGELTYKGIPIRLAPVLERSKDTGDGGAGKVAMLQHPDNMVWGIFHEVSIEPEREAKARRTDFVLNMEGDANYEDENAAVVAFIEQAPPAP